jgi:hypothetical protein
MKLDKSFHIYALYQLTMKLKSAILLMLLFTFQVGHAQSDNNPDFMRSTGKIYVVAAVTIVILVSIFIYLIILDRKITRIEKRHKNE